MDSLQIYYRTLSSDYEACLKHIQRKADAETIHELRVLIKQIRAFYHFLAFADTDFDFENHFGHIRILFKAAGKIRDIDITLAEAGESSSLSEFLRQKRRRYVPKLRKACTEMLSEALGKDKEIERILPGIEEGSIKKFLVKIVSRFEKEKGKRITDRRLHDLRKLCKEYVYVSQASGYSGKFLSQTGTLQNLTGKWHDKLIATDAISAFGKTENGNRELLDKLKKEERTMKKKAVRQFQIT